MFIASVFFAVFCQVTMADNNEPKPVVIHPIQKDDNQGREEIPRAPIRVPSLYIEDHTLSFSAACTGYTLELVQDEEIVYSYYIGDTDDLVLPSDLIGQYEIRLVGGSFTFVGEIEL